MEGGQLAGLIAVVFGAMAACLAVASGHVLVGMSSAMGVAVFFFASKKYYGRYPQALILLGTFWLTMVMPYSFSMRHGRILRIERWKPLISGDAYEFIYWCGVIISVAAYNLVAREENVTDEWKNGTRLACATAAIVFAFMGLVGLID